GHLAAARRAERRPQTLLPARVGVGDELDPVEALDLLEALREELEHQRPRFLGALGGDVDRDAPQAAQRNALFSFSKNPSSLRYVSSPADRSNSSSSRRCSSLRWRGTR